MFPVSNGLGQGDVASLPATEGWSYASSHSVTRLRSGSTWQGLHVLSCHAVAPEC